MSTAPAAPEEVPNALSMDSRRFDLWVTSRGPRGSYTVYANAQHLGQAEVETSFDLGAPPFADLSTLLASPTTAEEIRVLGAALFRCLFAGDVRSLFLLALGEVLGTEDLVLRLVLRIDPPELSILPWEMLFFAEREIFLATSPRTAVSRTLSLIEPVGSLTLPVALRILVVLPQSAGLDTGAEAQALAGF